MDSDFNNLQIFVSIPGFASTNNTIESFNGRIKKFFTKRELLTIRTAIEIICRELVSFYSVHSPEFKWTRTPDSITKKHSKLLTGESFVQKNEDLIIHNGLSSMHNIIISKRTCSCRWFLAYSMCSHLLKASELFCFSISNERPRKFVTRPRPGKKEIPKTFHQNFNKNPTIDQQKQVESI